MNTNKKNNQTLVFKTNINCGGCVAKITPVLNDISAIENWHVDTGNKDKLLTVEASGNTQAIIEQKVRAAGFNIENVEH